VETYARELALSSPLQAVLVDGDLLARYRKQGPDALRRHFKRSAEQTLSLKLSQIAREISGG